MAKKRSIIRTIYLYLFSLIGLALIIAGGVRFVDMGLKAFVFKGADEPERLQRQFYSSPPIPVEKLEQIQTGGELTEEEIALLKNWVTGYKQWQEGESKIDYLAAQRQREASSNLAMIIVGLPVYLYHWGMIKREAKEREDEYAVNNK